MKLYIAGKISGYSYEEIIEYFESTAKRLSKYTVFHPLLGKDYLRNEISLKAEGYSNPESTNHAIIGRDRWMVRNCDVMLCNLAGCTHVSIGSVMELGWAEMLHKHIVTVMEKDNIHRHAFVLEASDIVFETLEEALVYLEKLSD